MKTFKTVVITVVVTVVVGIICLFRFGVINTKADIETHNYQVYCDGALVNTYATETFKGVDASIDINHSYHIGR